jgi:hypothetical protein
VILRSYITTRILRSIMSKWGKEGWSPLAPPSARSPRLAKPPLRTCSLRSRLLPRAPKERAVRLMPAPLRSSAHFYMYSSPASRHRSLASRRAASASPPPPPRASAAQHRAVATSASPPLPIRRRRSVAVRLLLLSSTTRAQT